MRVSKVWQPPLLRGLQGASLGQTPIPGLSSPVGIGAPPATGNAARQRG